MWVFVSAVLRVPRSLTPALAVSVCVAFKDTLRECRPEDRQCLTYLPWVSPIYFVTFVLMAQFVLVNVVVAVLMKHLEESNKVRTSRSRDLSVIKQPPWRETCVCSCRRLKRTRRWMQRSPWKWPWSSSSAGQAWHPATAPWKGLMLDRVRIHQDRLDKTQ